MTLNRLGLEQIMSHPILFYSHPINYLNAFVIQFV